VPSVAVALATAYLGVAAVYPGALPVVAGAAILATGALVLTHRRARPLIRALVVAAVLVIAGLVGSVASHHSPSGGLLWLSLAVFLVPLPLVPWLYARSFAAREGTADHRPLTTDHTVPPHQEPRTTNRGAGGGAE